MWNRPLQEAVISLDAGESWEPFWFLSGAARLVGLAPAEEGKDFWSD